MKKLFLILCLLGYCLSAVATETPEPIDRTLRSFLGIVSIQFDYTNDSMLKGDEPRPYYSVSLLLFENGKLIKSDRHFLSKQRDAHLQGQVLWNKEGNCQVHTQEGFVDCSNATSTAPVWKPIWKHLSGAVGVQIPYEGYIILGLASSNIDYDGKDLFSFSSDFFRELKRKKYVFAVAIQTFKTREERDASQ